MDVDDVGKKQLFASMMFFGDQVTSANTSPPSPASSFDESGP